MNTVKPFYFLPLVLLLFIGCATQPSMYSIVVSNPGVQHEPNVLNDLDEPFKKKQVRFPSSIVKTSELTQKKLNETLAKYSVHTVDTTVKLGILNAKAQLTVNAAACGKKGIAILMHDASAITKKGKFVDLKLRYVCIDDNADVSWDESSALFWIGTEFYKIDMVTDCDICYDGFHTIEFQFAAPKANKGAKEPQLLRVLVVCAKP